MKIKIELEEVQMFNTLYYGVYIKKHWYNPWKKIYKTYDINDAKEKIDILKRNNFYLGNIF